MEVFLRADPESWAELRFAPTGDDAMENVNAPRRQAVLTEVPFGPQPADRALLRFLLEQEIRET